MWHSTQKFNRCSFYHFTLSFFLSFWASDNIFRCNFEVLNAENDVCIKFLAMRHFKTHLDLSKLRPLDMIFNFVY